MDQKSKSTILNGILKAMGSISEAAIRAGATQQPVKRGIAPGNCGKCPKAGVKLVPAAK
jgi:hypothetical protein